MDKDIIQIKYISTAEIITDVLTKFVGQVKFDAFIKKMGMA